MKQLLAFLRKVLDFIQICSSIALSLVGVVLIGFSFYDISTKISTTDDVPTLLLSNLSLLIIAIAILDVAKYVVEEAVYRESEIKTPQEARKTLTKFIVIVFVAISLETIVSIFLASKKDFALLVYPTFLLLANTLLLVGLGIYQKMSALLENKQP